MTDLVDVLDVVVVDRHRRDLGDLTDLIKSIENVELIHPIAITPDRRLIVGARRLAAFRQMGRDQIPARVIKNLTDAKSLLEAERDENTCRREMAPSEKVSLGRALEELESSLAEQRMKSGAAPDAGPSGNLSEGPASKGEVRDIVGAEVGMSGAIYDRAKFVLNATTDTDLPVEVREVAQAALAEMDATGKVTPAYTRVMDAKKAAGVVLPNGRAAPTIHPPAPPKYGGNRRKHVAILDAIVNSISGAVIALEGVEELDASVTAEEATRIRGDLSTQTAALHRIRKLILNRERTT